MQAVDGFIRACQDCARKRRNTHTQNYDGTKKRLRPNSSSIHISHLPQHKRTTPTGPSRIPIRNATTKSTKSTLCSGPHPSQLLSTEASTGHSPCLLLSRLASLSSKSFLRPAVMEAPGCGFSCPSQARRLNTCKSKSSAQHHPFDCTTLLQRPTHFSVEDSFDPPVRRTM